MPQIKAALKALLVSILLTTSITQPPMPKPNVGKFLMSDNPLMVLTANDSSSTSRASSDTTRSRGGGSSRPAASRSGDTMPPAQRYTGSSSSPNTESDSTRTPTGPRKETPVSVGKFMMADNPLKTIKRNARKAGTDVPDSLVDALIQQESGGDPDAVSSAGAVGLAQSMPKTARDPGYGVEPLDDPRDPEQARRFAEDYLGAMLDEFEDPGHALMAYNWGPGNVKRWKSNGGDPSKVPDETRDYVKSLGPAAARSIGREINTPFYSSGGGTVATAR